MSLRKAVNEMTAHQMISAGYSADDIPAIRLLSNYVTDNLERSGRASRKQTDRLSQNVTIKEVQKLMKNINVQYYIKNHLDMPTYKTVKLNDIKPVDNSHAYFRDRLFGTKENLKFRPSLVQLVDIGQ